jgi:hypothetical protein
MQWQLMIGIGCIVFALVVIIGANMWALQDGSRRDRAQRQRLERELQHLLLLESRKPPSGF